MSCTPGGVLHQPVDGRRLDAKCESRLRRISARILCRLTVYDNKHRNNNSNVPRSSNVKNLGFSLEYTTPRQCTLDLANKRPLSTAKPIWSYGVQLRG